MMVLLDIVHAVEKAAAKNKNFVELSRIAGLDPATDFRHLDYRNGDFAGCDLTGFDFTGTRLEGAKFRGAKVAGAIFDANYVEGELFRDAADYDALRAQRRRVLRNRDGDLAENIYPIEVPFEQFLELEPQDRLIASRFYPEIRRYVGDDLNAVQEKLLNKGSNPNHLQVLFDGKTYTPRDHLFVVGLLYVMYDEFFMTAEVSPIVLAAQRICEGLWGKPPLEKLFDEDAPSQLAMVREDVLDWSQDVNRKAFRGNTALHIATRRGCQKLVDALLARRDIDVNATNDDGATPLYMASLHGQRRAVHVLLDRGAALEPVAQKLGGRAGALTNRDSREEIVRALLGVGALRNA